MQALAVKLGLLEVTESSFPDVPVWLPLEVLTRDNPELTWWQS